jgi:uncharacterized membrane protein
MSHTRLEVVRGVASLRRPGPEVGLVATMSWLVLHAAFVARQFAGVSVPWWVALVALAGVFTPAVRLVSWKIEWPTTSRTEQIVYAFATVLLGLLTAGLALNAGLPLIGVDRPLDPIPVLIAVDAAVIALWLWRSDRSPPPARALTTWVPYSPRDVSVVVVAALSLALVCLGATRLNNGAGGGVSLAGLMCVAVVWTLLLWGRNRLSAAATHLCLYLVGLALLLMTSLRGWLVAGHDIQREFRLFRVVLENGAWDITTFRDPYNACLSVTILPTMIHNLTGLDPAYVMKVVPALAFATCPVVVYLIALRFVTQGPALLGVLTFMAFPTFFSDMPFLTRQEYAFTFLGASLLAATNLRFSVVRRRSLFGLFSVGVLLSHYSTNYVLIAVLGIALVIHSLLKMSHSWLPRRMTWLNRYKVRRDSRTREVRFVLGIVNVVVLLAMTLLWSQLLTGTNGQLLRTIGGSVTEMVHPGGQDARSSDTRYNLLGGAQVTPSERLALYRDDTLASTATERAQGVFLPLKDVAAPTPVVESEDLPLTPLGVALSWAGIDVHGTNAVIRASTARLLQLFVVIGMGAVVFGYRRRVNASAELTILAGSSFIIVLTQVVLPRLSVDYGVLRAFQQSLFLLAPFLAIGMIVSFSFLGRAAATVAGALGILFFVSLTGVLPQLTGGFPAQLHLNNSGQYFDIYYTHPAEVRAADWMLAQVAREGWSDDGGVQTDRFTFNRVQSFTRLDTASEIYPTKLRTKAYTLLGTATVTKGEASIGYQGDIIAYRYPMGILTSTKNQVYSNGMASVFR